MRRYALSTLATPLLTLCACELVGLTTILDDTQYIPPVEGKLAISEDGSQIWVNRDHPSGNLEVVGFANPTGTPLGLAGPFSSSVAVTDLAAAHEAGAEDGVWTLHANGVRVRWDGTGAFGGGLGLPDPIEDTFPEGARQWCGLAMGMDGAAYVMAGHQEGVQTHWHLYREKNGIATRTEGPFASASCPEIAYDLALDEVAVAVDGGYGSRDVFWFDPDTMDETHTVEIVAAPRAIAAFNHKVAVGSTSFIRVWNPNGTVADTEWGVSVEDLDVQYGDNIARLWWSGAGPDPISTVGWYRLQ